MFRGEIIMLEQFLHEIIIPALKICKQIIAGFKDHHKQIDITVSRSLS